MQAAQRSRRQKQQSTASTTSPTTGTTFATALSSSSWTQIGPQPTSTPFDFNPVSGRVTALAVDPTNPKVVYLGGAEGGVWKTADGGSTWAPLTDNQPSLAVGSIAIDPQNPQTIYVGTGEEDFALYNYAGAGILKSTDGGSTWTQLAGQFVGPFNSQSPFCGGAYIGSIAVEPGNSQVLLAGVLFHCSVGSGLYRSTDGGASWAEVLGTPQAPDLITGVVFDPTNGNNVYAAVGASSSTSNNGIWKSTDAGLTWKISNGSVTTAFPGASAGRISLAIAASSPTTLYVGAASAANGSASMLGVYKTTDGGATWTRLSSAPQYCSPDPATAQCYFDNVVAVAPNNPNIVLLGGSESATKSYAGTLYLSTDGGVTWKDITRDSSGNALHPDMHAIAFSKDGSKMFAGNDGGLWSTTLSSTGIGSWTNLNQALALTQFYPGMSINPVDPNQAFAGSQDNGIQEYNGSLTWDFVGCGDGGQTAFNYSDLNTLYLTCQYVAPNTGDFLFKLTTNPPTAVAADNGIDGTDRGAFIPPLTMDPSNPSTLYFGTDRLYQTTDGAANWTPISGDVTYNSQGILSTISTITVAPSDSNTVYMGTGDGRLWVTTRAGSGYCCSYITNGTPHRSVTAIAVNPTNAQTAYVTFSGYSGFADSLGHVFETTNAGTSWTDISGNLPNVPVNDIVVDPDMANTLYIGTDVGVFATTDGGATWAPLGSGLPAVVVMSLKLHHATRILRAASYGRSAWDIQLPVPVGPTAVLSTPTLAFAPQQVGTTSAAQTVTLTNNSSSALSISSITASSGFAETNDCGTSLAPGASCTLSVTFAPVTLGTQTGAVTLTDNASSGSPQTIALHGKGFSGAVSLSPASLSFADQLVGTTSAAQTVTLTNSSSAPLTITGLSAPTDFAVASDCPLSTAGTLAAGANCHINISFAPTAMGTLAEQVTLTDSAANSPQTIPVTGNGIAPVVSLSAYGLQFSQEVGTTSTQTVTLTNSGTADLLISQIVFNPTYNYNPDPLSESDNCPRSPTTISPQGSCTISVTFAPTTWLTSTSQSYAEGTVKITSNAITTPSFSVTASDYSGEATLSPTSITFPDQATGTSSPPQTATLTNTATTPLYITSVNVGPPSIFLEASDNCPIYPSALDAGQSCTISATFSPSSQLPPGKYTGGITIAGSEKSISQTLLYGTVLAPSIGLSRGLLDFGSQGVGTTSAPQTVNVRNTGTADLTISSLTITGANPSQFAIAASGTTCSAGISVAPGSSCSISVTFSPTVFGTQTATLSISDNALGSPHSVFLSGTGSSDFTLAPASGSSSTASVAAGGSAGYSLTVAPVGGFNQTVSLACSGAPSKATCTVTPGSVTLDGTHSQNVKVSVTTTAPSLAPPGPPDGPPPPGGFSVHGWWMALLWLLAMAALGLAFNQRRRRVPLLAGAVLVAALAMSCGGGGGSTGGGGGNTVTNPGTPKGTYTLTVTGASGSLQHKVDLQLIVQ